MSREKNKSTTHIFLLIMISALLALCIKLFMYEEEEKITVLSVDTGEVQKKAESDDQQMAALPDYVNVIMTWVIPTSTRQWFVKMTGPAEEFTSVQPLLEKIKGSLKFDDYSVEMVTFDLAEGWVKTREKGFIHSSITHPDLKSKLTISSASGSLLSNINRWRRQLGMGPLSAPMLAQLVQMKYITMTNINGYFGIVVPVLREKGASSVNQPAHPPVKRPEPETPEVSGSKGIRVAFGLADNQTWYIKMTGSSNTLILQKKNFESFVSSFKFGGDKPSWTVPEGWSAGVQGSMSIGTFTVADSTVTVTPLGAQSGSLDSNVNRWRRQISLPAQTLEEIQKSLQKISVDGNEFNYLFISSTSGEVDVPENHPKIDNGGEK